MATHAPIQPSLFRTQISAKAKLESDLVNTGQAFLKAGHRSGKTAIVERILSKTEPDFDCLGYWGLVIPDGWPAGKPSFAHLTVRQIESLDPQLRILFVLDEAMWIVDSFSLFVAIRNQGFPCLVCSSNGPEYAKNPREWPMIGGHSYSTWELNLGVTRESLESEYRRDPGAAKRDYEAY